MALTLDDNLLQKSTMLSPWTTTPTSTITNEQRWQMQDLRGRLLDILPADLDTEWNLYRWIHGWRGDVNEACKRLRAYIENRAPAGVDVPDFHCRHHLLSHPIIKKYISFFPVSLSPDMFNTLDNTAVTVQRFEGVDFHEMTKVMTCNEFVWLNFVVCEWMLRQVLRRERLTGRRSGLTIIYDLENFSLVNYMNPTSAIFKIFKLCLGVLQDYFCDMLHRLLIINAPRMVSIVLDVIKTFLNPVTREKFIVVKDEEQLARYVDRRALPARFGGERRLAAVECELEGLDTRMDPEACVLIPKAISAQDYVQTAGKHVFAHVESVKPKQTFEVKQRVNKVDAVLTWRFRASTEVQFTVVRVDNGGKKVRLFPCWTVNTPALPETGKIVCKEIGDYIVEFSHVTNSWMNMKLEYEVEVREA